MDYEFIRDKAPALRHLRRNVLAICGGGNAGHALAVVASKRFNGDVVWLVSGEERAELLRRGVYSPAGLRATGVVEGQADNIRAISSDPVQIIPDADIVLIAVPAFAHEPILKRIAPYLKETALVGSLPTRGGFEFEATNLVKGIEPFGRRAIFGLQTLPWSARIVEPGKIVNFGTQKATVLMAALPQRRAGEIAAQLTDLIGTNIVPTENFLNMTLGNPGQVVHPGILYGFFSNWTGERYTEDTIPHFYRDASDETGRVVEHLSDEIVAVARRIEARSSGVLDLSGVNSIHDWLKASYPAQTKDTSTVATCFRTGPLQHRKAPMHEVAPGLYEPKFAYRYLTEDVPYGLAVVKAIAEVAEVETPAIDAVILWAQEKLGKQYMIGGKLNGRDARELPTPHHAGIKTLTHLIDWYAAWDVSQTVNYA